MCYVDHGDYSSVWKEVTQKARKEHACGCCGLRIAAGEVYMRTGSLFDGRWSTYIDCGRCIRAGDEFQRLHGVRVRGVLLADHILESLAWIGKFFQIDRDDDGLEIRWDLPAPLGVQE